MVTAFPDRAARGDDLTEREQAALASLAHYDKEDSGYSKQQSTRPQTIGYGLVDSPAGQCAWIVEKFWAWTDCDGDPATVLTRDEMLDNIMLYWLPGTGASVGPAVLGELPQAAARAGRRAGRAAPSSPRRSSGRPGAGPSSASRHLHYWNELDKGGHFAAFEQPATFVSEVRAAFRPLRQD